MQETESENSRVVRFIENTFGVMKFPNPLSSGKAYVWVSHPAPTKLQLAARGGAIALVGVTAIGLISWFLVTGEQSRIERCVTDLSTENASEIDVEGLCRQIIQGQSIRRL
jgi:hypothetical protein